MTIQEYARQILKEHDCDEYTYGGELADGLMNDLKAAYPNGMQYSYQDVTDAILSISRPKPNIITPYRMIFDMGNIVDSIDFDSFDAAKKNMKDTYLGWLVEARAGWEGDSPTEREKEDFNYMIANYCCYIVKWDDELQDYQDVDDGYMIPDNELAELGWQEIFN